MGVDVMRPAFNLEPKCTVIVLTREEWNRGPGRAHLVHRLFKNNRGDQGCVLWAIFGKKAFISLGTYATVFQAEVYTILACVYEIQTQVRPEKSV
jgi:hypothetical protein